VHTLLCIGLLASLWFVVDALRVVALIWPATVLARQPGARTRRVFRRLPDPQQIRREAAAAARVTLVDALVIATVLQMRLMDFAPAPNAASYVARTAWTFAVLFVWFEIAYWGLHRLLHTRALYFIHAQHHTARITQATSAFSFSMLERALQTALGFGFVVMTSRTLHFTAVGVHGYIIASYVLNIWGHVNFELVPSWFARSRVGRVFITATFHALHHARYRGHYGLYTTVLDRLFGTIYPDYEQIQARAADGHGLTHLNQRISVPQFPCVRKRPLIAGGPSGLVVALGLLLIPRPALAGATPANHTAANHTVFAAAGWERFTHSDSQRFDGPELGLGYRASLNRVLAVTVQNRAAGEFAGGRGTCLGELGVSAGVELSTPVGVRWLLINAAGRAALDWARLFAPPYWDPHPPKVSDHAWGDRLVPRAEVAIGAMALITRNLHLTLEGAWSLAPFTKFEAEHIPEDTRAGDFPLFKPTYNLSSFAARVAVGWTI
jgi:sterol desaturase/sphingolipid hydroxylase (fatty acid hydroxylase superfamily)